MFPVLQAGDFLKLLPPYMAFHESCQGHAHFVVASATVNSILTAYTNIMRTDYMSSTSPMARRCIQRYFH